MRGSLLRGEGTAHAGEGHEVPEEVALSWNVTGRKDRSDRRVTLARPELLVPLGPRGQRDRQDSREKSVSRGRQVHRGHLRRMPRA